MDQPHTLVQDQYGHDTLLVLAFNKDASTGIGIIHWFSTSMGTFHYRYWHPNMVPVGLNRQKHLPRPTTDRRLGIARIQNREKRAKNKVRSKQ
jgi:hypothetical protein